MNPTFDTVHTCPSCQTKADGHYCSRCGEAVKVHSPTAHEFVHEFIGHYVALEGKLWGTLRLLLLKPGQLTVDFLRGRRIAYINPLRLYLTVSLVLFGLIKLYGVDLPQLTLDDRSVGVLYTHSLPHPTHPKRKGTVRVDLRLTQGDEAGDMSVDRALAWLGSVNPHWTENAKRFIAAPSAEKAELINHGLLANLPYMLICALPLFALYLKLMYLRSGRYYGEHLVFALHVSAFTFLVASGMILLPGSLVWLLVCANPQIFASISLWDWLQLLPAAWIVAYLPFALHRVYGGARWAVWCKSLVLMTVHLLVVFGMVVGAECIAILRHG